MYTLAQIAAYLGGEISGNPDSVISGIASLQSAKNGDITLVSEKKYFPEIPKSPASAFIVFQKISLDVNQIIVKNPRKALAQVLNLFHPAQSVIPGISNKAEISPTATIDPSSNIGPFCVVEENTQIGAGTMLKSNVFVGKNCHIGRNCVLAANVVVYDNCKIGDNVIIQAGAIIGSDGFGFYPDADKWGKIPQVGAVIIGDNVEIGANTTIDRGCLDNTTIGSGVKIDNLVHIAHNCTIGDNCVIAAQSGFSGGVTVGKHIVVAGQAGLNGHITVGDNTMILGRAGVTKSVGCNAVVSGFPAKDHRLDLQEQAILSQLIKKNRRKL